MGFIAGQTRTWVFSRPRNSILRSPLAPPLSIIITRRRRRQHSAATTRLIGTNKNNAITTGSNHDTGTGHRCLPYHSHLDCPEPCSSASGPFSSSITGTTLTSGRTIRTTNNNKHTCCTPSSNQHTFASISPSSTPSSSRNCSPTPCSNVNPSFFSGPHRPSPKRQMAFTNFSTASSDISTPRSSSPSISVVSGRSSHSSVSSKRLSLSLSRRQSAFNPMSSVDITAIQEQMKMASLDGLRGYSQDHYAEVQQYSQTEYISKSAASGYQVLREPAWNKGAYYLPYVP